MKVIKINENTIKKIVSETLKSILMENMQDEMITFHGSTASFDNFDLSFKKVTLEADVVWKSGSQSKIYLMQDSKRAEFTGNTLTTVLSDNFDVSQTIYIVAEDTKGNSTKKKLKIKL